MPYFNFELYLSFGNLALSFYRLQSIIWISCRFSLHITNDDFYNAINRICMKEISNNLFSYNILCINAGITCLVIQTIYITLDVLFLTLLGLLCGLVGSALDYRSVPPQFESQHGHIWRVFNLWLRFIIFGDSSAPI